MGKHARLPEEPAGFLGTCEAAVRLGLSPSRVLQLCRQGVLKAAKIGRVWFIDPASLEAARARAGPGRPRQAKGRGSSDAGA